MNKLIIIFLFLIGCSSSQNNVKIDIPKIDFSDDLSIEEFKNKLDVYANNSPYPNIDN
jgi:hypothetical protein|tara:strand:- start:502 stop:675 length:174 start_codon:yes stop_codon:yes gene_type:complete